MICAAGECMMTFTPTPMQNTTPLIVVLIVAVSVIVVAALLGFAYVVVLKNPYDGL